ncbi:MAG: BPSL0067 family protein [Methylocella sp.]
MLGQSVGTGQCVALAQATSDVGYTSTWSPGAQVQGDTDIAVGTVIATFGSDGTYTNTMGNRTQRFGQGDQGIFVEDQWLGQAAGTRWILWTTSNSYESGSKFRLSSNSIVNKYGGYQQVFAMHHIGSLVFRRQYLAKFMFARNRRQQWTTHTG